MITCIYLQSCWIIIVEDGKNPASNILDCYHHTSATSACVQWDDAASLRVQLLRLEMISAPFLHLHQHWINILIKLWENSLELDNSLRVNTTDEDDDDDDDLDAEYSVDVFVSEARTVKTADISPGSDRGMRLDNGSNDIKTRLYLDISAPAIMQWMNITHAEKQSLLEYFIINLCHPLQ